MEPRKVSLSDAVARDLPLPAKGDLIYWDTKTPYFGLRVQAGGTRTWIVQKKLHGRTCKVKLGVFVRPGDDRVRRMSYQEARRASVEPIAAITAGRDPNGARADEAHTVQRCLELYIEHCETGTRPRKAGTLRGYRKAKLRIEGTALARVPLVELTGQHLLDYVTTMCRKAKGNVRAKRGGNTQVSQDLRVLRAAYTYAVRKWRLTLSDNPFLTLNEDLPGWFKTHARQVTVAAAAGQLETWWAAVEDVRGGADAEGLASYDKKRKRVSAAIADFLILAVLWGTRRTELLELRWDYINLEYGYLRAPGQPSEWGQGTKNGEDNVRPLTRYVRELLERRRRENEEFIPGSAWVFPSPRKNAAGKYWHIAEPKGVIARVRTACGMDFSPQDLRRTFGSLFVEVEEGSDAVRVALNHAATDTASKHYLLSRLETYRAIYQRYEDKVLEEAGVRSSPPEQVAVTADEYAQFLAWKAANGIPAE